MKTLIFNSAKSLKKKKIKRETIKNINGVECSEKHPIIEITNSYVSYYDVDKQGSVLLNPPFIVKVMPPAV